MSDSENLKVIVEKILNPKKLIVWYTFWFEDIIGLHFFSKITLLPSNHSTLDSFSLPLKNVLSDTQHNRIQIYCRKTFQKNISLFWPPRSLHKSEKINIRPVFADITCEACAKVIENYLKMNKYCKQSGICY